MLRIIDVYPRGAFVIGTVKSRRRAAPAGGHENGGIVFARRGFAKAQLADGRMVGDFLKGPASVARMAERLPNHPKVSLFTPHSDQTAAATFSATAAPPRCGQAGDFVAVR